MTKQTPKPTQAKPQAQAAAPVAAGGEASQQKPLSQSQAADKIKNLIAPSQKQNTNQSAQKPKPASGAHKGQPDPNKKAAKPLDAAQNDANQADTDADGEHLDADTENDADTALDGDNEGSESDIADDENAEETDAGDDSADDDGSEEEAEHIVVVDGNEFKVSYEELVAGYQRQADYTRKSQALAKERKEVEAIKAEVKDLPEKKKEYQQGADKFIKNAHLVLATLETRFMPQPPPIELSKTDPAAYLHQKEVYQEALHFAGAVKNELVAFENRAKQEHQAAVDAGRAKLFEALPEMKDQASRNKLTAYANSLGFTNEQIAQEANHVLFVCVEKARKYDELMANKANLRDKKPLPKVTKRTNAQPSAEAIKERQKQQTQEKHRSSGTIQSAEEAIKASLFRGRQ